MSAANRSWTVACLAGDGVGPELMGEASRALAEVARLHALHIDDVHLPFGGEAMTRFGHPLPLSTREAYRDADAILVSSPDDPALDGVTADLELAWRVSRVHNQPRGDLLVVEPVGRGTGRARDRARVRDRGARGGRGSPPSASRPSGTSWSRSRQTAGTASTSSC